MKSILIALLWISLILLVVFAFPKTCGSKYFEEVMNSNIKYKCLGFPGPDLSKISGSEKQYNWCYGICLQNSKEILTQTEEQEDNAILEIPIIASFTESFRKVVKPIIIILLVIGIILAVQKFSKAGKNDIVVYSNRMK